MNVYAHLLNPSPLIKVPCPCLPHAWIEVWVLKKVVQKEVHPQKWRESEEKQVEKYPPVPE